jgi:hypothetical protein
VRLGVKRLEDPLDVMDPTRGWVELRRGWRDVRWLRG